VLNSVELKNNKPVLDKDEEIVTQDTDVLCRVSKSVHHGFWAAFRKKVPFLVGGSVYLTTHKRLIIVGHEISLYDHQPSPECDHVRTMSIDLDHVEHAQVLGLYDLHSPKLDNIRLEGHKSADTGSTFPLHLVLDVNDVWSKDTSADPDETNKKRWLQVAIGFHSHKACDKFVCELEDLQGNSFRVVRLEPFSNYNY